MKVSNHLLKGTTEQEITSTHLHFLGEDPQT